MSEKSPEQIAKALSEIDILVSAIAENASHIARARRALYLAYMAEGFTEQQALELCKTVMLT